MTTPPDPFAPPPPGEPNPSPEHPTAPPPGYPPPPPYGAPQPPPYGYQQPPPYGQPQPQWGAPPPYGTPLGAPPKNGFGLAALILGILGFVLSWVPGLGLLLGLSAIVFAILGRKRAGRQEATNGGMAIAGLVLGILTTIIGLVVVTVLVFFASSISDYAECVDKSDGTSAELQACADKFQDELQNP